MVASFKRSIPITAFVLTPEDDLIPCDTIGCGYNPIGKVSIILDDPRCSGTGFLNLYTQIAFHGYFSPRAIKRWNSVEGGFTFLGDASVKIEPQFRHIVDRAAFLRLRGVNWNFATLTEQGDALANSRISYTLTRKA